MIVFKYSNNAIFFYKDTFVSASAFCSWPCNWQGKTFFNDAGNAKISFPNAYTLEVKFGGTTTKIECVQRNGQYLINR